MDERYYEMKKSIKVLETSEHRLVNENRELRARLEEDKGKSIKISPKRTNEAVYYSYVNDTAVQIDPIKLQNARTSRVNKYSCISRSEKRTDSWLTLIIYS